MLTYTSFLASAFHGNQKGIVYPVSAEVAHFRTSIDHKTNNSNSTLSKMLIHNTFLHIPEVPMRIPVLHLQIITLRLLRNQERMETQKIRPLRLCTVRSIDSRNSS